MTTPDITTPIEPEQRSERRRIGGLIIGSALLSAIGVGALAYTATNAAFSGTTDSTGSFTAASVTLTDDDFAGANFVAADMLPGDVATDCIEITYTGIAPARLAGLKVYGTSSGDLADNLDLTITHRGSGTTCSSAPASNAVYSGTLAGLGIDYAGGSNGSVPLASGETVAYDFTVTLQSGTLDEAQGDNATATFVWEVQTV